jgi:hypothetical protein
MRGDFSYENDAEWAIVVGGTGEFAHAHGVVTAKVIQPHTAATGRIWELDIHAFSLCISGTVRYNLSLVFVVYSVSSKMHIVLVFGLNQAFFQIYTTMHCGMEGLHFNFCR